MTDAAAPATSATIGQLVTFGQTFLAQAGIDRARAEARLLLAYLLKVDQAHILAYDDDTVSAGEAQLYLDWLARRARHEPVSRITGHREFWSLDFALNDATLDPRADSETLVEAVLATLDDRARPWRLLDLGTGSGCLLLALLSELPQAAGLGIDIAEAAVSQARHNAQHLGLAQRGQFAVGHWADDIQVPFDVIVANPPYIALSEAADLDDNVRLYDPPLALFGGADGLDAYRYLIPQAAHILNRDGAGGGLLALEIGASQAGAIAALCQAAGFQHVSIRQDLAGKDRVVLASVKIKLGTRPSCP